VTFKEAVEATEGLAEAWRAGFAALRGVDKPHLVAEDTRRLRGSVNIDAALQEQYPGDPRWEYGIGHQPANLDAEMVYWVEIHPANSREVNIVLQKLAWLKKWLRESGPRLNALRREFIWVSSGRTSFTLSAPQRKQFVLQGLQHRGRVFRIPNQAVA
jgi:hypothetical protein